MFRHHGFTDPHTNVCVCCLNVAVSVSGMFTLHNVRLLFNTSLTTWYDAQTYCASTRGSLAGMRTTAERKLVAHT